MKRKLILAALLIVAFETNAATPLADKVDWPAFMARQDLVFETLPTHFDYGAFLGNGLLGAMIYRDGDNRLRFEMGRSDVTEHRRDNARLPIGGLVLETIGKIQDGTMRLDLWNAEVRGTVTTDKGTLQFRAFIHTDVMALLLDLETSDGEKAAKFVWVPGHGQDKRNRERFKEDPPNPPATTETIDGLPVCVQPRHAGGEFATAWKECGAGLQPARDTKMAGFKPAPHCRRVILSVADSFPGNAARREVVATVQTTIAADFDKLVASHREWWHALYPKSFVSVPDPKLESFYWIQFYKLGSASRPDRVPVDLLGPWFRDTGWPRIWWNLNIETLYLPVYAANQLELGESFVRFLDAKRANFVRNAKEIYGFDDCATVPHTTCYEGLRGDGSCAPDKYINPGDFTWALHNYYLHYRHSMDHALVTNQTRHAFYPLLRGSINLYLRLLKKGDDGKLHLPVQHSPEYGDAADNNYNLALLRWGCQTLIDLNQRYRLNDPLLPRWRETLANLTPYPVDENGLRIGADVAFTKSHRHWSHILMVHPLHIMDANDPAQRELLYKSIHHWLTVDGSRGVNGWSRAAAASLYAALGDGDNAIKQIHGHMADRRFVRPNTMYIEGSPVIECSIVLARSLQDMLLQSHNNIIRVFPAVPAAWTNAIFHNLRAEGAFLVSAERRGGKTQWVRIKSLAGEPCRIQFDGKIHEFQLAQGDERVLGKGPATVAPLPIAPAEANPHGIKKAISTGKRATASSVWGKGYEADNAFDGDETTRWSAAPKTRSGWLEVDLGAPTPISRAVVGEANFRRIEQFAIEYKDGDTWKPLVSGATIDRSKSYDFSPVTARYFRLNILKANEIPTITEFQLFHQKGKP
ncbi:MAG: discoidin domain-containing protein [Verrucomicrobia bacterium]|nr:discoidin domain-containing protein [Verrucomicrobiota bacterium]